MHEHHGRAARAAGGETAAGEGNLLVLGVLALVVGVASGLIGALFRLTLIWCDGLRDQWIAWARTGSFAGLLIVIGGTATAVALAAWIVGGSSRWPPAAAFRMSKRCCTATDRAASPFPSSSSAACSLSASGLALGREGPSVQMGARRASASDGVPPRLADCRVLLAAGAGAGLATAFNAPIAGAVFVLEELARRFERASPSRRSAHRRRDRVARVCWVTRPDFHSRARVARSPDRPALSSRWRARWPCRRRL